MKVIKKKPEEFHAYQWNGSTWEEYCEYAKKVREETGIVVYFDKDDYHVSVNWQNIYKGEYLLIDRNKMCQKLTEEDFNKYYKK
jgi:hypothetical protein